MNANGLARAEAGRLKAWARLAVHFRLPGDDEKPRFSFHPLSRRNYECFESGNDR